MQLQQEINAIDAVRANTTRNRNKASPRDPEVGLNFEHFPVVLMLLILALCFKKAIDMATFQLC